MISPSRPWDNFQLPLVRVPLAKMTSLYEQSVPVFIKYLNNLSAIVEKGRKFAEEKAMKDEELITFRLVPDMRGYVNTSTSSFSQSVWCLSNDYKADFQ